MSDQLSSIGTYAMERYSIFERSIDWFERLQSIVLYCKSLPSFSHSLTHVDYWHSNSHTHSVSIVHRSTNGSTQCTASQLASHVPVALVHQPYPPQQAFPTNTPLQIFHDTIQRSQGPPCFRSDPRPDETLRSTVDRVN